MEGDISKSSDERHSNTDRHTETSSETTESDVRPRSETGTNEIYIRKENESDTGTPDLNRRLSVEQIASRYLWSNRNIRLGSIRQTTVISHLFMINN